MRTGKPGSAGGDVQRGLGGAGAFLGGTRGTLGLLVGLGDGADRGGLGLAAGLGGALASEGAGANETDERKKDENAFHDFVECFGGIMADAQSPRNCGFRSDLGRG